MSLMDAFQNLINRFVVSPLEARLATRQPAHIAALEARVKLLEKRAFDYHRHRWNAVEAIADYLVGAQLAGHYLEFGVFQGTTFARAALVMAPALPEMRFFAFDSFEGLPDPQGIDNKQGYSAGFHGGQFSCSEEDFLANLGEQGVDLGRVTTVPGWFAQTLQADKAAGLGIDKVAAAWIDCDLYESTVPVLDFLTQRLSVGSVIFFDDWRSFRNLPGLGEEKACQEWLQANPQIKLRELFRLSWHGIAFTVAQC
jgi:O-methyltransferase